MQRIRAMFRNLLSRVNKRTISAKPPAKRKRILPETRERMALASERADLAKAYLKIVSLEANQKNNPLVVAKTRLGRLISDIDTIRAQFKQGGYTPETVTAFEESVKVFEANIKALKLLF